MMNRKSIKQAMVQSAEGYPLLGWMIWWSHSGFDENIANIKKALMDLGIDEDYASPTAASTALQASFDAATLGQSKSNLKKHSVKAESQTILALVRGTATGADVLFDAITKGYLLGEDAHVTGEFADHILADFQKRKASYNGQQFVNMVKDYIQDEADALTLRDAGGIYFIPAHKKDEYEKMLKLFEAFPAAQLDVFPLVDSAQAKRSIYTALTADIEGEIAKLQAEIAKWNEEGDPRDGVVARRLDEYRELKEKVGDYSTLLQGAASGLQEKLDQVAEALRKKL